MAKIQVEADGDRPEITVELVQAIGKTSQKPYTALRLTVGEYVSDLIFPKGEMERNYLIRALS